MTHPDSGYVKNETHARNVRKVKNLYPNAVLARSARGYMILTGVSLGSEMVGGPARSEKGAWAMAAGLAEIEVSLGIVDEPRTKGE